MRRSRSPISLRRLKSWAEAPRARSEIATRRQTQSRPAGRLAQSQPNPPTTARTLPVLFLFFKPIARTDRSRSAPSQPTTAPGKVHEVDISAAFSQRADHRACRNCRSRCPRLFHARKDHKAHAKRGCGLRAQVVRNRLRAPVACRQVQRAKRALIMAETPPVGQTLRA